MSDRSESTDGNPADQQQFLEQLVGEGKRYANVEELAKAKVNADAFIEQLKTETGELREDLEKRMTLDDILKQKESSNTPVEPVDPAPPADAAEGKPAEVAQNVDEDDLNVKIREVMDRVSVERTADTNLTTVADRLVEDYGDAEKARTAVEARARELGLSTKNLMDTAATSPKAFYTIMGLQGSGPKSAGSGTKSDVLSTAAGSGSRKQGASRESYADFQELRRSNPREYYSPKVQNRMLALYAEKGEAFLNS
jgi:hypothetical protein